MQENEFENRVQQKLEDLHLRPSSEVWEKVEKELKEKKKRRTVVFFLLFAGLLLLGYTSYMLFSSNDSKKYVSGDREISAMPDTGSSTHTEENSSATTPNPESMEQEQTAVRIPVTTAAPVQEKTGSVSTTAGVKRNRSEEISNTEQITSGNAVNYTITKAATGKKKREEKTEKILSEENIPSAIPAETSAETLAVNERKPEEKVVEKAIVTGVAADADSTIVIHSISADSLVASTENKQEQDTATVAKKKKKIKLGLDLSAGMTMSRSHVLSLGGNPFLFSDFNGGSNTASGPVNSGGVGNGAGALPPSSIRSGLSFRIGMTAVLPLSSRSHLSSGIRYGYMSEKLKVGAYKDTSVTSSYSQYGYASIRGVYRSSPERTYTNRYHFVEIPVLYHLRLNRGKKLPVEWNGGFSASFLLGTNALLYDTAAGGVYYRQQRAFNRVHFSLNTGLAFRFADEKKISWTLGPEVSFDLSRVMKEDHFSPKRYLFYGGITGRLFFNRQKK